jgi:hypothetical protein
LSRLPFLPVVEGEPNAKHIFTESWRIESKKYVTFSPLHLKRKKYGGQWLAFDCVAEVVVLDEPGCQLVMAQVALYQKTLVSEPFCEALYEEGVGFFVSR